MKLTNEELKHISAGATAVEYGTLLTALIAVIQKIVDFFKSL